ncbi:TPA: hypothetical protein J1056_004602 [Escherichia coli]|nr:hypothetical protein [Escherichia coli]EIA9362899.1 hypothetical protein [Salmonella enterica]HDP0187950.1 hypothetical protein [Salmonella enterica subsp. enterica serovar Concord]HAZ3670849.1 hypothetical protein [Escherichia coli]HBA8214022.1 hypothetical protein [Escherichia coli]
MNKAEHLMYSSFDSAVGESVSRISHYIELHRGFPHVSFSDHIKRRRSERAARARSLKLIYLDTNAWKCVSDFRLNKASLTPAMKTFGTSIERAVQTGRFVFPIGLPTYFELDSMTDPATRETLTRLVDELSQGICITPFSERVGSELRKLRMSKLDEPEGLEDFLCSPIELMGVPTISTLGYLESYVDKETFNKAVFDALSELPFSFQLEIARTSLGAKWDNSRGITELNDGKAKHQSEIANLNTAIFIELTGGITAWFREEGIPISLLDIKRYALEAQYYWHKMPDSRAMPTLRVLSSLYGLMRYDPQRRYKNGDPNDFMVAASALPVADALYTDRKLANLLSDKRIELNRFSDCTVVSGFENMAAHLEEQL